MSGIIAEAQHRLSPSITQIVWHGLAAEYYRLCKQWQGKPLFLHHLVQIPGSSAHSGGKGIMHREIRFTPTSKNAFVSRWCRRKCSCCTDATKDTREHSFWFLFPTCSPKGAPDMMENTHIFNISKDLWNQAEEAEIRAFYQAALLTFKSGQMKPRLDESNPIKFPFKTR